MPRWSRSPPPSRSRWHAERPVAIGAALGGCRPRARHRPRPTDPIALRRKLRQAWGCEPLRRRAASIPPRRDALPAAHHPRVTLIPVWPGTNSPCRASASAEKTPSGQQLIPWSLAVIGVRRATASMPAIWHSNVAARAGRPQIDHAATICPKASSMLPATGRSAPAAAGWGQRIRPSGSIRAADIPPDRLTLPGGRAMAETG